MSIATATEESAVRRHLSAFMGSAFSFAAGVHLVREGRELPPVLERVARGAEDLGRSWLAWRDERRTWFVTGEFAPATGALRTFFYDPQGRLAARATWRLTPGGHWRLWER